MGAQKSYRCSKGHVMRGANIGIRLGGKQAGQRYCVKCARERSRANYKDKQSGRERITQAQRRLNDIAEFWKWAPEWMERTGYDEEELLKRFPSFKGTKPRQ